MSTKENMKIFSLNFQLLKFQTFPVPQLKLSIACYPLNVIKYSTRACGRRDKHHDSHTNEHENNTKCVEPKNSTFPWHLCGNRCEKRK